MYLSKIRILSLFCIVCLFVKVSRAQQDIEKSIEQLFPKARVQKLPKSNHFKSEYIITINQLKNHSDIKHGIFPQRIFLSHSSFDSPMVLCISGYAAQYETSEISSMLNSNQIIVEYRFYGKSKNDTIDYQYLTNEQAIKDIHFIIKKLRTIYTEKWLSTGSSKGGTTCLIHKAFYPDDIDATIVYNAPLLISSDDYRIHQFINKIGNEEIRNKILHFQKHVFNRIDSIGNLIKMDFSECSYTRIGGIHNALQYAILDFPYIYWQMGHSTALFNNQNSSIDYYNVLKSVVDLTKYCDEEILRNQNAYYQFFTENGYYQHQEIRKTELGLTINKPAKTIFLQQSLQKPYNPKIILETYYKLSNYCDKIIQINGQNDPWSSAVWIPYNSTKNVYLSIKQRHHNIEIRDLDEIYKSLIISKLKIWLNTNVNID